MYRAHTVSTSIAASPEAVYKYAAEPSNLPPPNDFGVLEQEVDLSSGTFHNTMRVIPNGAGSAA